jgi:chromosomal replication initiation ATPase DnaA
MSLLKPTSLLTAEQEFITELNNYLEYPLGKHGEIKVKNMLLAYKAKNPAFKIIKFAEPTQPIFGIKKYRKSINPSDIINIVSEYTTIPQKSIVSNRRHAEWVYARYLCIFFIRKYTMMSLNNIGNLIGNKHHTTIIHALQTFKDMFQTIEKAQIDANNINIKIQQFKASLK